MSRWGADVEPVGIAEIADRLGVARATVDKWRTRDLLPEPRGTVGGRPAWDWWRDIAPWARRTSRLPDGVRRAAIESQVDRLARTGWSDAAKALRDPYARDAAVDRAMSLLDIGDEDPGDHDQTGWM